MHRDNIMARKLECSGALSDADLDRLDTVIAEPRPVPARQDIIRHGERPENVHLVLDGMACRYKIMPDGRRSIMAVLVPGDICDIHIAILGRMDHGIATLSDCRIVDIPRSTVDELLGEYPRIARALFWATLVDEAVLREWLVNMGKRRSDRQMAHLLCELHLRLEAVGRDGDRFEITQEQLADMLGITPVHAQRAVGTLREAGLIDWTSGRLTILDVGRLREFAEFDDDYLHLRQARRSS